MRLVLILLLVPRLWETRPALVSRLTRLRVHSLPVSHRSRESSGPGQLLRDSRPGLTCPRWWRGSGTGPTPPRTKTRDGSEWSDRGWGLRLWRRLSEIDHFTFRKTSISWTRTAQLVSIAVMCISPCAALRAVTSVRCSLRGVRVRGVSVFPVALSVLCVCDLRRGGSDRQHGC